MADRDLCGLARGVVVPVDPRRLSRLRYERRHVAAAEHRTSSHRHPAWRCAPASDRSRRAVPVVAADNRYVRVEQLANFGRYCLEDFGGRGVTSDERRNSAERRLLFGKLRERLV